ncbi:MAG: glycosyltransferase family 4 protein [Chloroflexi bacterium]|nr:glycosyltransferase family 4 protein [Chloroflexota bacterium]
MRVGIDGLVLRGRDAGTLRYVEQLLAGLAADPANEYVVFANRQVLSPGAAPTTASLRYSDVRPVGVLPPALRQQLFRGWHARGKLDLLHCPAFVPPLVFSSGLKTVMTVHDLAVELYPQMKKWTGLLWSRLLFRRGIEKADRIIAVSESTKADLIKSYGIAGEKISVVHHCVPEAFKPVPIQPELTARYKLPERYVLYVGTLEPRKNIPNLIRAFALARQRGGLPHVLVLAGARGWLYQDIFRTVAELELQGQVLFLDYVPEQDLPALYSGADLFAYLSWYEGFGLPVLEAMACGVPVLASNLSSLPEVVGDAGVLVAPGDVEQAACELARILSDSETRRALIARGCVRAHAFSMERFTRETLAVYSAGGGPRSS